MIWQSISRKKSIKIGNVLFAGMAFGTIGVSIFQSQ